YVDLEKIRLQNRLHYEEHVDPGLLSYSIPVMILQPLVENAIKHGISNSSNGGWIRLNISKEENKIVCRLDNSLPVYSAEDSSTPQWGG
ncbi:MAG: histidine kinase, partial [Aliifodinibius sp.]|nr:histidine kinase [Fodinibius sp.]